MIYVYDKTELREAYGLLNFMESQRHIDWGDEITKQKREIRKYNKQPKRSVFHFKGDRVEKTFLPKEINTKKKAEKYFNDYEELTGEGIKTIDHKIVNVNDVNGKYCLYNIMRLTY